MLVVCASGGRTIAAGRDTISHRPYITLLINIRFSLVRRRLSEWAITQAVDWRRPIRITVALALVENSESQKGQAAWSMME